MWRFTLAGAFRPDWLLWSHHQARPLRVVIILGFDEELDDNKHCQQYSFGDTRNRGRKRRASQEKDARGGVAGEGATKIGPRTAQTQTISARSPLRRSVARRGLSAAGDRGPGTVRGPK